MENDSSPALLQVKNLTKKYLIKKSFFKKDFFYAVNDVSFSIQKNEIVGLVGESGSGKSTIGKLILKLISSSSGDVLFKNKSIFKLSKQEEKIFRKQTAVVFQDPRTSLNPKWKIKDILEEPLIVHSEPKSSRKEKVIKALNDAGLDETFLERYPLELSGGQRQRVAIARAIILKPDLIVADEPTSALDVSIQLQIIKLIQNLKEKLKISFLFISHDLNVVGMLADKVVVLYRGKIMEKGEADKVLKNPKHPYTKLLLESLPPESPHYRKDFNKIPEIARKHVKNACEFYHRCPIATDLCKTKPKLQNIQNQEVYCHFV